MEWLKIDCRERLPCYAKPDFRFSAHRNIYACSAHASNKVSFAKNHFIDLNYHMPHKKK